MDTDNQASQVEEQSVTEAPVVEESASTETPEAASVEAAASGGEVKPEGEGESQDLSGQQAQADFSPNLEYEVRGEKKKFDERFKDLIKSKEHEDALRDLYTKADGIETIKEQREFIRNQHQALQQEVNKVIDMTQKGDLASALQSVGWNTNDISKTLQGLGYSNRDIIEHAYKLANLTPEQEQYQNQLRQAEVERFELTQQRQQFQTELQAMQVQARRTELQNILSTPDIKPIVEAYDQEYGKNSFFKEVANRGTLHWHTQRRDVPVNELVQEVLRFARHLKPEQTQTPPQAAPKKKADLPVIPNLGGGGGQAPVKKKITSIKELKRYAQTLED